MSFIENQLKRNYNPGDAVFKDGDAGESMFILLEGEVEISKVIGDNNVVLATLQPGSIFGEMAIINRRPRSASAIVTGHATALQISRELFYKRLEDVPRWMQAFFEIMAERLREATEKQSVRTPESAANQFLNIITLLSKEVEPDTMDRLVMPWKKTVATVAMLMDEVEAKVNDMMNKLVTAKMAKSDKKEGMGRVLILEMPQDLYRFADYSKNEFLLAGGHIEELPAEFHMGKPHAEKVIEAVGAVMAAEGALDDFTAAALEAMLHEKYKKPFVYFKTAIEGLITEGVLNVFKGDDGDGYRVNDRELFSEKQRKLKLLQAFSELRERLAG